MVRSIGLALGLVPGLVSACDTHVGKPLVPPDATVLFDGTSFRGWRAHDGGPIRWKIENGELEVAPGAGNLETEAVFEDFFLHAEYNLPLMADKHGQERANSGLYLLDRYEVQILDSFQNPTYFAGHAGSLYKLIPAWQPDGVNVSLPPGRWQTFDIVFHAPRVAGGKRRRPGTITVIHNRVPVIVGGTFDHGTGQKESAPQDTPGPIVLQDHGARVRFRNLWIKPIPR